MCPHCRRYAAQIRAIGTVARNLFREQGEDPKARERLERTILRAGLAPDHVFGIRLTSRRGLV